MNGVLVSLKIEMNGNGDYVATFLAPPDTAGHSQVVQPNSKTPIKSDQSQECVYTLKPLDANWGDLTHSSQVEWLVECSTSY